MRARGGRRRLDDIDAALVGEALSALGNGYFVTRGAAPDASADGVHYPGTYLAGGYKYAMAGEGACFMHCPPGFGARPRNTGWYASFAFAIATSSLLAAVYRNRRVRHAMMELIHRITGRYPRLWP